MFFDFLQSDGLKDLQKLMNYNLSFFLKHPYLPSQFTQRETHDDPSDECFLGLPLVETLRAFFLKNDHTILASDQHVFQAKIDLLC